MNVASDPPPLVVDTFAGPGGWDEGMRMLARTARVVGVEWDADACCTAMAAGHERIRADVAELDPRMFGQVEGLIASPPCQAWSMAGKRKGELDRVNCHRLADRMAAGDDSLDWTTWEDPRSALVCQPVRWVRELRPEWVALEEVPAVASLWEHFAHIFRAWGYSVWTGDLNSADYGVPQTRVRRILIARRSGLAMPPEPTHAEVEMSGDLFGGPGRGRWVSMANALGWGDRSVGYRLHRGAGMIERHGDRPVTPMNEPAPVVTGKARSASWVPDGMRAGDQRKATVRSIDEPAATILGSADNGGTRWIYRGSNQAHAAKRHLDQPAPNVNFAERANKVEWMPEDHAADPKASGVRVTVIEAGILQSFPADYPWRGSKSKQYLQVGNAIPPVLAAHIIAACLGVQVESLGRAA